MEEAIGARRMRRDEEEGLVALPTEPHHHHVVGIKTGKRKRPAPSSSERGASSRGPTLSSAAAGTAAGHGISSGGSAAAQASARGGGSGGKNQSAADALRASLLGGGGVNVSSGGGDGEEKSDVQSRLDSRVSSYKNNESAIHGLQSRGRISNDAVSKEDDSIMINHGTGAASKSTIQYENEKGVRYNSRGKLSRHAHDQLRQNTEQEMTIAEMAAHERSGASSNMDEQYARNVIKMGKGYKKLEKLMGSNSRTGADEEDCGQETAMISDLYRSNDDKMAPAELAARGKSRQIAHHDALSKWTAKSWWWMESNKFDKRYLIALGEKVGLVMTPTNRRLQQHPKKGAWGGGQCYIVPLPYSESFVGLDEEVWCEVRRFQSCLRRMFQKEGRGVIFLETVTRTSKSASGGSAGGGAALQAKMEVIPVPLSVERDAQLYFKSALAEVAQEWGTHGARPIALDGRTKTLRNAVPRQGFPYFYCGWGEHGSEGYVQLIEEEDDGDEANNGMRGGGGSRRFPRDFGIDTIGGMMDCDPVRFQRRSPAGDGDRAEILEFCRRWKEFDWTLELDG